jgi:hypothetical protein
MTMGRETYNTNRHRELSIEERLQKAANLENRIRGVIDALDEEGRWIEDGWIYSGTFNRNVGYLLSYLDYSGHEFGDPSLPIFDESSYTASTNSITLEISVRSTVHGGIDSVTLRLTPPTSTEVHAFVDDGTMGDRIAGDGIFTLAYKTEPHTSLPVYQGVVVAEDVQGGWNLILVPLGMISRAASGLAGIRSAIAEASGLGVDLSTLWGELALLEGEFNHTPDEDGLEAILKSVGELETRVQAMTVSGLIEIAADLIESAKDMGIDTSRHEIFLSRAREEFDKGNYGPARQFTNYPLGLREEVKEPFLAMLLPLMLIPLARRLTSLSRAWP